MRFNQSTDYALRVLTYLGLKGEELSTITEIANNYDISRNHLMKVIHRLGREGFIYTQRGKGGGLRLARPPSEIYLGDVIRRTEEDWDLVECFRKESNNMCRIRSSCVLPGILRRGLDAFLSVLDEYTVEDLLAKKAPLTAILQPHKIQGRKKAAG